MLFLPRKTKLRVGVFCKQTNQNNIMPFVIDNQLIIGCDQNSRIYCESFNTLCQALPDDAIEISSEKMSELDLSALCIYMGKYVEQEINSSVVQLMRKCCGVSMPDYYCKRDPSLATQCDIVTGSSRVVRLNEQANRKDETSLRTIPLGEAFYALEALLQTHPSFFDNYKFINDYRFIETWRKLFIFRNNTAHIGRIISLQEAQNNYKTFKNFLNYMEDISKLKQELSPEIIVPEPAEENQSTNEEVQEAHAENVAEYERLWAKYRETGSDDDLSALNNYLSSYNWFTRIIVGPDGKKGMEDPAGKILIPTKYDAIGCTFDTTFITLSTVPCSINGKFGLVKTDGTGNNVTPFEYDDMLSIPNCYLFKKNGCHSFGILKMDGTEVLPCILDSYTEPINGVMYFSSGLYQGLWLMNHNILIPAIYDNIEFVELDEPLLFTKNGVLGYVDYDKNFVPKSEIDAIEDEDWKHDRLLEFICEESEC